MKRPVTQLTVSTIGGLAAFATAQAATVVPFSDLFNTGVDAGRNPLPDNAPEIHYDFSAQPAIDPTTGPVVATEANGFPIPPWVGDNATSAWITPRANTTGADGNYTYRTTFTVPAGADLSQVYITGALASDNLTTDILVNGVSTGIMGTGGFGGFNSPFAIQKGFVTGVNTLEFVVNEAGGSIDNNGFTGLRVEMGGGHAPVGHVSIPGLTNTGVAGGPDSSPLGEDATELHFTLNPTSTLTGPTFIATSANGFPIGPWLGDSIDSAWIAPSTDTNAPVGSFLYDITFDLTGLDPATASIVGRWASDDGGTDIFLNGVSLGETNVGFVGFTDFSIAADEGDVFLPGMNTLSFALGNSAVGPSGLRVEFLSASAAPIPEPGGLSLLGAALGLILLGRRR